MCVCVCAPMCIVFNIPRTFAVLGMLDAGDHGTMIFQNFGNYPPNATYTVLLADSIMYNAPIVVY